MDPVSAKYIGAGLATMGMIGAGAGLGILFGNYLQGAIRNPTAAGPERIWLFPSTTHRARLVSGSTRNMFSGLNRCAMRSTPH